MALYIITGVPGSGKTYYAVNWIAKNHFHYKEGIFLKNSNDILVVTNIDDLKIDHQPLQQIMTEYNLPLKTFFTYDYQEKLNLKYKNIIYIIDEAQQYFNQRFNDNNVLLFFEKHRHLGIDIFLITQSVMSLSKRIQVLAEKEIRAVPRTLNLIGEFKYKYIVANEIIQTEMVKPKKSIFNLYTSMTKKEKTKIKNPLLKILLIPMLLVFFGIFAFKYVFLDRHQNKNIEKEEKAYFESSSKKEIEYNLLPINYFTIDQDEILVVDELTNTIIPESIYPYELIKIKGPGVRTIYASLPGDIYNQIIKIRTAPLEGGRVRENEKDEQQP